MDDPIASIGTQGASQAGEDGAAIVERIRCCVERISVEFDRWNDPRAHGPGLYFVVESDSTAAFSEQMGTNRWPVEDCASVFASFDALCETAKKVAFACDGAVVVHSDGTIEEEMVRMKQLSTVESERIGRLPYAGWMGTRHMSALETSTREEIFAVVTLSEENGRMTIFTDGTFEEHPRDELRNEWQIDD